jgi:hypothetical protein
MVGELDVTQRRAPALIDAGGMEITMSNCVISFAPAVAAGLFSTVIAFSPNMVLAADDCIEQPNRQPAPGEHWSYRTDRVNNRKCWHLTEPAPMTPQAEAPEAQSSPGPSSQPSQSPARVGQVDEQRAPPLNKPKSDALSQFEE